MNHIAFIGLGHMGYPMAMNLLNAGYHVTVFDVVPALRDRFKNTHARMATSLTDLSEQVDTVITSVQTSEQVKEVCLGVNGIFRQSRQDLFFIDCSSIDITTTRELHVEAANHGVMMIDAPVSGGVASATTGNLTIMVGGHEDAYKRALPILQVLGKKIIHAGVGGNGQVAKICNNLLLGISMIGVSEAFTLAQKLGLDPKKFYDISSNASGQCWSMTSYCPVPDVIPNVPANNNYEPGFMAKMMLKDLYLSQHAAESVHAFSPLGTLTRELYELFVNQGGGEKDFSNIIRLISGSSVIST